MLRWRLVGALTTIIPLLALFWMDDQMNFGHPGIWLALIGLFLSANAAAEFADLFQQKCPGLATRRFVLGAINFALISAIPIFRDHENCALGTWGWASLALLAALAYQLIEEMIAFDDGAGIAHRTSLTFLGSIYAGLPFCFFLYLRLGLDGRTGLLAIFSAIFVIKWSDAGAYFVGRLVGRTKLAPKISPGKTVEGLVGGLVAAALAAWVFHAMIMPRLVENAHAVSMPTLIAYGIALAVIGVLGDLSISMLKRDAGKKDSASWLPGLGGVLDIVDSVLWGAPVAYLFWVSGLLG